MEIAIGFLDGNGASILANHISITDWSPLPSGSSQYCAQPSLHRGQRRSLEATTTCVVPVLGRSRRFQWLIVVRL